MIYGLIRYDWSIQAESALPGISGKAYITKEDNIFNDCVLYYLYTSNGDFVSMYWSESEARLAAAAQGLECEEKIRPATVSLPRPLDFEAMKGLIL
jgi:hypothetical protein